jgi:hypothetical protein
MGSNVGLGETVRVKKLRNTTLMNARDLDLDYSQCVESDQMIELNFDELELCTAIKMGCDANICTFESKKLRDCCRA